MEQKTDLITPQGLQSQKDLATMPDPTPSTRPQGTKQGKKHSNKHAETKQTPPAEGAKTGPKAHPHEKEGNTAIAQRKPQAGTDTRPSQSPQHLTGGQAPPASRNPGRNRGNRQEHTRNCNQKQIKRD